MQSKTPAGSHAGWPDDPRTPRFSRRAYHRRTTKVKHAPRRLGPQSDRTATTEAELFSTLPHGSGNGWGGPIDLGPHSPMSLEPRPWSWPLAPCGLSRGARAVRHEAYGPAHRLVTAIQPSGSLALRGRIRIRRSLAHDEFVPVLVSRSHGPSGGPVLRNPGLCSGASVRSRPPSWWRPGHHRARSTGRNRAQSNYTLWPLLICSRLRRSTRRTRRSGAGRLTDGAPV